MIPNEKTLLGENSLYLFWNDRSEPDQKHGRLFHRHVEVREPLDTSARYAPLRGKVPARFWRLIATDTRERSREVLPLYFSMELDSPAQDYELHAVACLFSLATVDDAITWLRIAAEYPKALRGAFLDRLQFEDRAKAPAADFALDVIRALPAYFSDPAALGHRFVEVLEAGTKKVSIPVVEYWFHAITQGRALHLSDVRPGASYPARRIEALTGDANYLWDELVWRDGDPGWLEDPELDAMPVEARLRYLKERLERDGSPSWLASGLFRKVVGANLLSGTRLDVLGRFAAALGSSDVLSAAPERSFQILNKECRSSNETELLDQGLATLAALCPAVASEAFAHYPKQLCAVARTCGAVNKDRVRQILRPVLADALFTARDWPLIALDNLLTSRRAIARKLPLFDQWDLHFSGQRVLKPGAVGPMAERMKQQLILLRLWTIEEAVTAALAEGVARPVDKHALLVSAVRAPNRRQLRRFLASPVDAELYIRNHEHTRQWVRRHPRLRLDAWREGFALEREVEGAGRIRLAYEQDPAEILKLGTYVGSCLGLGGVNVKNAPAVLLDVNKRVIFARDAKGTFLARQIVAINTDGHLVPHSVYPHVAHADVKAAFADFNEVLAWKAGVPLFRYSERHEEVRVDPVIATAWYDDGAWDPVGENWLDAA